MRLRKVKYAAELIADFPQYVIADPGKHRGKWHELFENKNSIELEIGCGKGKFIYEKALNNPDRNFIGIEKFDSVIVRALEKLIEGPLPNLKLIRFDAEHIENIFSENEITRLYLNFSDPWPKTRQAKRRLTSNRFLSRYTNIIEKDGIIELKTDNKSFFEYSIEEFQNDNRYAVDKVEWDLYNNLPEDNIQTEFEMRFVEKGNSIYYLKIIHKGESHETTL